MRFALRFLAWLAVCLPVLVSAQVDPYKRDLIQFGYNQPLEGRSPLAAYAYYYRNDPNFFRTNLTLRLAVSPVYIDSELGFLHGLGPNTDFGIGVAGGAFADSYNEIDGGTWNQGRSFEGHGGEMSASIYHLINPTQQIPLELILRGIAHYTMYKDNENTEKGFQLPDDAGIFSVRTGVRYGGIEPTLFPALAMELSGWYEGSFRTDDSSYGINHDETVEQSSHKFWGSAALAYTFDKSKQSFFVQGIAATTINADRLNCFRLGGFLPLSAEYPLMLPGYFYQELSARQFALINASYLLPIAPDQRWSLYFNGATAYVDYVPGTDQSSPDSLRNPNWVSGVGAGILYRSPDGRFKVMLTYAYGVNAIRDNNHGANTIGLLFQFNLEKSKYSRFDSSAPGHWQGWNWLLGR